MGKRICEDGKEGDYMGIFCFFLIGFCLFLLGKLIVQRHQINEIRNQVDFIYSRDTQVDITLEKLDKCAERLAISINHLLEKYHYIGQQIKRNDTLFKDTITSLSHDLRTPLATANGYIQLLLGQELSEEQREYVEIAGERISAVKLLLDQLFELARIEANELKFQRQNIDVHSTLRDVLATYYNDFEKKASAPEIYIPNEPAIIWADKDALSRVFSNIIYNSLIHGDGGYKICSVITGNRCNIIISNQSKTIFKDDIPHLFDRFYTTDQSRTKKTTGLGLAIARKLILQMNGDISAHLRNDIFEIRISFKVLQLGLQ